MDANCDKKNPFCPEHHARKAEIQHIKDMQACVKKTIQDSLTDVKKDTRRELDGLQTEMRQGFREVKEDLKDFHRSQEIVNKEIRNDIKEMRWKMALLIGAASVTSASVSAGIFSLL